MSVSIEDILLMKAQQDAQANDENGLAIGALLGGLGGANHARLTNADDQLKIRKADAMAAAEGASRTRVGRAKDAIRPGTRMATTALLGTLLGGALGKGAQEAFLRDAPSAEYLAKMQMGTELTFREKQELEGILAETYKSIIGA